MKEKEGKHDLKKSITWGIYKSNKDKYMKLERIKIHQFSMISEPTDNQTMQIMKLKNDDEETP